MKRIFSSKKDKDKDGDKKDSKDSKDSRDSRDSVGDASSPALTNSGMINSPSGGASGAVARGRSKTAPPVVVSPSTGSTKLVGSPSVGEITPPIPPDIELERMFANLLDDLGFTGDQRKAMLAFPRERKWTMICQNQNKAALVKEKDNSPEYFIKMIKTNLSHKELEALRISLSSEPIKWVQSFLEQKGLALLVDVISNIQKRQTPNDGELDIVTESVRCVRAIMNMAASTGIEEVVGSPDTIRTIVKCIDIVSMKFTPVILEMLAALCLVSPDAHSIITDLMRNKLLTTLVDFLKQKTMIDLQISTITLINAIISSENAEDADCEDFKARLDGIGFQKLIQDLRKIRRDEGVESDAELDTQLDVFDELVEDSMRPSRTPVELFTILLEQLKGTQVVSKGVLHSALQHLLLVKKESTPGLISWDLIDRFVQHLAMVQITNDRVAVGKMVCQNFIHSLETMGDPTSIYANLPEKEAAEREIDNLRAKIRNAEPEPTSPRVPEGDWVGSPSPVSPAPAPPLPPPLGGPPPPPNAPAPPLPPGMKGSGPPPPPPPSKKGPPAVPSSLKPKPVIKPNQKMKQFDWTKINPNKINNTVWVSLDDSKISIDGNEFESIFAAAPPPAEKKEVEKAAAKPKVITVLDTKRSQNITIMLSSFKQSFPEIKKAIMNLDEESLTTENVMALLQFTPVSEEIELLKEHVNNTTNLAKAEQFFVEIMGIPRLETRLECWVYKRTFETRLFSLQREIDGLDTSCNGVRSSLKLLKILEVVLAVGNYINGSTFRGGAYGFKLDSLVKMGDVRSGGASKLSLMHYLAQLVESKMPDIAALADDFPELEESSKSNLKQMEADLNSLRKGLSQIDKELHNLPEDSRDPFKTTMQEFYDISSREFEVVAKNYQKLLTKFKSLLEYFGEDPNQDSDVFFGTVYKFISNFEKAKKDNARRKALEKKAAEQARRAEQLKEKKVAKSNGAMDQLVDSMRTGEAFNKRSERGSAIHPNAALAQEAIEMFSRVNRRGVRSPNLADGAQRTQGGADGAQRTQAGGAGGEEAPAAARKSSTGASGASGGANMITKSKK